MSVPGRLRARLVQRLNAAYAVGLISDQTLAARLDQVLNRPLIDPKPLVGDLWLRDRRRGLQARVSQAKTAVAARLGALLEDDGAENLLALDWEYATGELIVGRSSRCDVVLADVTVSRRHARLLRRDGSWVLQDLSSTNGSYLNGQRVGRCELRPGDQLGFGDARLRVD